ncbi:acyltransferase family protein [Buttiauxella gaviniae]|uniref:Acyltransferase family protein n=1 Tax=Buttiauxella gaviniae TaxID=82990 RepID=A0ABV3NY18_9ENTR
MDEKAVNIRALAAIMVVILHINSQYFHDISSYWPVFAVIGAAMRPCVPLFLMLSGYLLVGKPVGVITFMKKRVSRLIPPILFWGGFYVVFISIVGDAPISIISFIRILIEPPMFHLWYLYLIVGVYLTVPILSGWYVSSSLSDKIFYVSLWLTCLILGGSYIGVDVINRYYLGQFSTYVFYLLAGALIRDINTRFEFNKNICLIFFAVFTGAISALTIVNSAKTGIPSEEYYEYTSPLVAMQSLSIFYYLLSFDKSSSVTSVISSRSLGIYCVHVSVILCIFPWVKLYISMPFASYVFSFTFTVIASLSICSVIGRIKYIRRVV